jgi:hypothetical protein
MWAWLAPIGRDRSVILPVEEQPRQSHMVALPRAKGRADGKGGCDQPRHAGRGDAGPSRRDEDTRGGFAHGGWAVPRGDDVIVAKAAERMGSDRALLFGRRTYEQLLASWNARMGRSWTRSTTLRSTSLRTTPRRGSDGRTRRFWTVMSRPR